MTEPPLTPSRTPEAVAAQLRAQITALRIADPRRIVVESRDPEEAWNAAIDAVLTILAGDRAASQVQPSAEEEQGEPECQCGSKGTRGWRDPRCLIHGELSPADLERWRNAMATLTEMEDALLAAPPERTNT